jgi:hypothetical protein
MASQSVKVLADQSLMPLVLSKDYDLRRLTHTPILGL